MIKIEKGQVEFDGEGRELLAEFAAIVCNLLKYFSEAELKAAEAEYTAALKPGEEMVSMGDIFDASMDSLKLD